MPQDSSSASTDHKTPVRFMRNDEKMLVIWFGTDFIAALIICIISSVSGVANFVMSVFVLSLYGLPGFCVYILGRWMKQFKFGFSGLFFVYILGFGVFVQPRAFPSSFLENADMPAKEVLIPVISFVYVLIMWVLRMRIFDRMKIGPGPRSPNRSRVKRS
jgi:hypothetical protein